MRPLARATLAAFALLSFVCCASARPVAAAPKAPRAAPTFRLPGRAGEVNSDSLRARLVLVDFWASWCVPCRKSFPWLAHMQTRFGDKGLAVVAVNLDKERDAAEAFLAKYPAPFTVAFDPQGGTADAWHVEGMPTTYLVAADRTVLLSHAGFDDKSAAEFEARVGKELTP